MDSHEEERIKIMLYNKFHEQNKDLYENKPEEYFYAQRVFIEKEFEKIKYNLK